jgi:hypothetical protein
LTHVQIIQCQYNQTAPSGKLRYVSNRQGVLDRVEDECVRRTLAVDLDLVAHLDAQIAELERFLNAQAKGHDLPTFYRLRSIPGVGKVLALTMLYEIGDIRRFDHVGQFLSYARLVRPTKESAGKRTGRAGEVTSLDEFLKKSRERFGGGSGGGPEGGGGDGSRGERLLDHLTCPSEMSVNAPAGTA